GEVWTLHLPGGNYATTAAAGDTLAAIVQRIAAQIPASSFASTVVGTVLSVARDATLGSISASVTVSPPTVGTISRDFLFFNEADVVFAGQPVAGETWTLTLDGTAHSVVSHDGDSLASVVQGLAALIPPDYQVSVGLNSLFVVHGFGLFGGFFSISLTGSVTLNPTQVYGGANVQQATPVGIDVTPNG